MAITLEAIRAAGGIVHSDGNIFFRDISMLQGLAGAAPAAVAPRGEYPHEQMDAMALDRYKVVPSNASMLWSHAVVAGDGTQQLYVGREVECQNMVRKFAGAFLDGAFAFHSTAAAPTAQAAPALEAPAAPVRQVLTDAQITHLQETRVGEPSPSRPIDASDWMNFARAIEAAALAALAKCDPAWRQGQRELLQYVARRACDPALPVDVVRAAHAAIPDELAARLRKAAATLAVRHSSYSNISIAWPDEKLLKSAEGRYHQALADLDALISAIPTETKQTADRDQLDSLARKNLGALLNAFGEAQWQAGRGVPCPSIEDAFEAVISAAVGLLAAQPVATDAYLKLADAMGYDSGKDGIEWSPEEWAAHLLAAYRVAPAAPFGYAAYWPNQVEKATLFPPKLGDSTWAAFRNAGQIVTPLYERPAPAAPAVDAPAKGEVVVEVHGLTGSGKSAICGEIEIMCRALGLEVAWPGGESEKRMTHAEWTAAIEAYKPRVRIVERNVPRQSNGGPAK